MTTFQVDDKTVNRCFIKYLFGIKHDILYTLHCCTNEYSKITTIIIRAVSLTRDKAHLLDSVVQVNMRSARRNKTPKKQ